MVPRTVYRGACSSRIIPSAATIRSATDAVAAETRRVGHRAEPVPQQASDTDRPPCGGGRRGWIRVRNRPLTLAHARMSSQPLIRSYFTPPNLRLKTPALTLLVCPLTSIDVCWFPSWLLYFSAVLPAVADWHPAARQPAGRAEGPGARRLAGDGSTDRPQTALDLRRSSRHCLFRHVFGTASATRAVSASVGILPVPCEVVLAPGHSRVQGLTREVLAGIGKSLSSQGRAEDDRPVGGHSAYSSLPVGGT